MEHLVRFRQATPEDVPAIVTLVNAAYRGTGGKRGWTTEEHLVEGARAVAPELLEMMAAPGSRFEVALADGGERIVGSVHLHKEEAGSCYLGMLSVDPDAQASGIGRALMLRAEEVALSWGCHRMRITVLDVRAELLAYYERRGYERTGRMHAFPGSARSRLKLPDVRMVEMEKRLS